MKLFSPNKGRVRNGSAYPNQNIHRLDMSCLALSINEILSILPLNLAFNKPNDA